MVTKTVKRLWARIWWGALAGIVVLILLSRFVPDVWKDLCALGVFVSAGAVFLSLHKLRCPYCGAGAPRTAPLSAKRTICCRFCGRAFVFDDEV